MKKKAFVLKKLKTFIALFNQLSFKLNDHPVRVRAGGLKNIGNQRVIRYCKSNETDYPLHYQLLTGYTFWGQSVKYLQLNHCVNK